jgi:hypothetical protein
MHFFSFNNHTQSDMSYEEKRASCSIYNTFRAPESGLTLSVFYQTGSERRDEISVIKRNLCLAGCGLVNNDEST